jgi:outer membrane protein TolC
MRHVVTSMGMVASVAIAWLGWSTGTAGAEPMTLGQVYAMAVQHSEDLQIEVENVRQAEQDERRALSAILPKVTLGGDYTRTPPETGIAGSTILIQPRRVTGGKPGCSSRFILAGRIAPDGASPSNRWRWRERTFA